MPLIIFSSFLFFEDLYYEYKFNSIELSDDFSKKYNVNGLKLSFLTKNYRDRIKNTYIIYKVVMLLNNKPFIDLEYLHNPKNYSCILIGNFDNDIEKEIYIRGFKKYDNYIVDLDKNSLPVIKKIPVDSRIIKYYDKKYKFLGNLNDQIILLSLFGLGVILSFLFSIAKTILFLRKN